MISSRLLTAAPRQIAATAALVGAAVVLAPGVARADKIVESEPNGTMLTANQLVGFNDLQALGTIGRARLSFRFESKR